MAIKFRLERDKQDPVAHARLEIDGNGNLALLINDIYVLEITHESGKLYRYPMEQTEMSHLDFLIFDGTRRIEVVG